MTALNAPALPPAEPATPPAPRHAAGPVGGGEPVVSGAVFGAVRAALVLAASGAALVSGFAWQRGDHTLVVLPVVLLVAVALGVMALTRFSWFVLLLLGLRPSIDLLKLSGDPTGNVAGNTAAAKGMDPSSILAVLFLLTALLWLAARHYSGRRVPGSRLGAALGVVVAAGFISVIGSSQPQASVMEAMRIASVAMMFLVLEQLIDSRAALERALVACYVGLAYPLVYTTFGIVTGNPSSDVKGSFSRLTGPFNQSNTFARYLAFVVIMGVALHPQTRGKVKVLLGSMTALSTVYMILTLTRTAIIGGLVGVVVVAVVQRRKRLIVGLVIGAAAALVLLPGVAARFATLDAQSSLGGGPTGNTLEWRLGYWAQVLPLANHNPVTGIGLNVTQFQTDDAKQPHNDFIRAYVEMGALGLGAFVALLTALVGNGRRALARAPTGSLEHAVAAGALGTAVAFLLECAAANVMSNVVSLWYLVAFAAAASYVARTSHRNEDGGSDEGAPSTALVGRVSPRGLAGDGG
jgi:O-antigen ligase